MARRPITGLRRAGRDERLPLTDHLDELRRRIMISIVALIAAFIVLYIERDWLISVLANPLPEKYQNEIVTFSPTEPFFTTLKVVFWGSVLAALPIWLYQLYAFIVPAITDQSRRVALAVVGGLSVLFVGGVLFGYFVVLPVALQFLLGFGDETFNVQLRASEYFGFTTTMLLASGLLFEVPIAMLAFARLGVVTAKIYRQQWRVALVAIAVFAALLPGGDPVSMLLLMIPQILLYILGVWLAATFGRAAVWDKSSWTADEEPDPTGP